MAKHKRLKKIYTYKCSLTGLSFKTTREAPHPDELLSVDAYYELHPEEDKRPEVEKHKRKQVFEELKAQLASQEETLSQGNEQEEIEETEN